MLKRLSLILIICIIFLFPWMACYYTVKRSIHPADSVGAIHRVRDKSPYLKVHMKDGSL
jgi:hypothetical protein